MLRRYWKHYLKLEEKQLRRAFYETHSEQRMRTRGNDAEKQSESHIGSKFKDLTAQMEIAKSVVEMMSMRESLKNYQLEYSIKSSLSRLSRFLYPNRSNE